jgi:predicted PurR-regulated permease PerM
MQATLNWPQWRRRAGIGLVVLALGLGALWLIAHIPRTLTVFVIAAFIAFGVNPIVAWLTRRVPRGLAIGIVYTGLLATIVVLVVLIVPALLAQVTNLASNAPTYVTTVQDWIDNLQTALRARLGHTVLPSGTADLRDLLASKVALAFNAGITSITAILVDTVTAAFIGISAIVLSAFFVYRGEHITDFVDEFFPPERRAAVRALVAELANVFGAYVSGQLALCAITGALIYALTTFAGLRYALLLGILSGIAYAIPFIGQIFAHLLATILAAPQGGYEILWVNAIVFVVARVSDNLLVPRIMSKSVGISPIVVMFAVFAGGELFGLPGLLLGIPVAAMTMVVWRFIRSGALLAKGERSVATKRATMAPGASEGEVTPARPAPSTPAPTPREA